MYQICVSGAAKGESVLAGQAMAREAGIALAKSGQALLTGATNGIPLEAATAYKQAGGMMSIGISPASSKIEHVLKYRLPTKPYDAIIYTGMHYSGRDAFLINSADAVISIGGRIGTLHEATTAIETLTPIGFLQGAGGTSGLIDEILVAAEHQKDDNIMFGDDPIELLNRLIALLDKEHQQYIKLYDE
ncbi:MAG: SLOG cluster 4 domain-containing protein [Candidatus Saccharimonadales bacterium]